MTHVMEGRLKGIMEEADKEKALKQVSEASLNEKNLGAERSKAAGNYCREGTGVGRAKGEGSSKETREAEVKLVEAASLVSTCDKELADLKETMKTCEQVFYNMGFKDAKNSAGVVILQDRKFGFAKGWMAAVNAIGLPDTSPFRNADQILLLEDPQVEA